LPPEETPLTTGVIVFFFGSKLGESSAVEVVTDGDEDLEGASKAIQAVVASVEETMAALPRAEDPDGAKTEDPSFTLVRVDGGDSVQTVLREVGARVVKLLVVGRRQRGSSEPSQSDVCPTLFERAPCTTLMIRPGADASESAARVLVPTAGGPHARIAFEIAGDLAAASDGEVTALYVQTESGSDAEAFGQHALQRVTARVPSRHRDRTREKVALARSVREGILAEAAGYDLVLLGSSSKSFVQRLLFRTVPEKLLAGPEGAPAPVPWISPWRSPREWRPPMRSGARASLRRSRAWRLRHPSCRRSPPRAWR
jgi:nucleotide-binding universal stress UspA family protein